MDNNKNGGSYLGIIKQCLTNATAIYILLLLSQLKKFNNEKKKKSERSNRKLRTEFVLDLVE